jgi:hypothetical protein
MVVRKSAMPTPSIIVRLTLCCASIAVASLLPGNAAASPHIPAGDLALRQDIQTLADHGILKGPVSSWPLAWGPIVADIDRVDAAASHPPQVASALSRVREKVPRRTGTRELRLHGHASVGEEPARIRGFAGTPRETGEAGAGISWAGNRLSVDLNAQVVSSPDDDKRYRADGSMIAVSLGNFEIAASTMDRWWGPGWDGSLILSNNARPIPALTVDRVFTDEFETRWLSWLGPWDLSVMFGQMESERAIPDTRFFGLRINFRPLPSLELGLSRTAQWCGEDRPCDLDTFAKLLTGRDNLGGGGIDRDNEPGNQLAGVDFRWAFRTLDLPVAAYGQFVGEDEAGGFPSKYLGQVGIEASGTWRDRWSWRGFAEAAITKCRFYRADVDSNCAYNHGSYRTGYRYRGRSVGHGADNDARVLSAGLLLADENDTSWQLLLRYGELNRYGPPDTGNTLSPTRQDLAGVDVSHSRAFRYGVIAIGAGVERVDDAVSQRADTDVRAFMEWRTSR